MRWLVTLAAGADLRRAADELKKMGYQTIEGRKPIVMDEGDVVLQIEGPASLPKDAKRVDGVVKVSPSSEMTPY